MKKLFKKTTVLFVAMLACFPLAVMAQIDASDKLSVSTQMFLDELEGRTSFKKSTPAPNIGHPRQNAPRMRERGKNRPGMFASPDTIDGKAYISAFIRLDNNKDLSALEALGVKVGAKFDNGLITADIPVENVRQVAALANVSSVNVATVMRMQTDKARQYTNTDDVLTLSPDAIRAGLPNSYDGTGVLLGIIDSGIDFQHVAFKDKNGNSRIKGAYVYDGWNTKTYTSVSDTEPTTDNDEEDHGTHTSSTAGGSSVVVSGSSVTVTDNHGSATYGGMAPGADLYLCGLSSLVSTKIAESFQKIINYADSHNMPVVVSNSWGSQGGAHDGSGDLASVINQYFNDNKPNHICLFASSNDAGQAPASEGGGFHFCGTTSKNNPLGSIFRYAYGYDDNGYYYDGAIDAWTRSSFTGSLACRIFVLDANNGNVLTSVEKTTSGNVSGLSSYYSGTLSVNFYSSNGKKQVKVSASNLSSRSYGGYTLAVQFYPTGNSSTFIDVWSEDYAYFTNYLTTPGLYLDARFRRHERQRRCHRGQCHLRRCLRFQDQREGLPQQDIQHLGNGWRHRRLLKLCHRRPKSHGHCLSLDFGSRFHCCGRRQPFRHLGSNELYQRQQ